MLGSAFALIGNSSATGFSSGTVSYQEVYYHGSSSLGSGSQSIVVTTLSGIYVTTLSGPSGKVTLPSGNYYFMVKPKALQSGSNYIITNGTKMQVEVGTGSSTVLVKISAYLTSKEKFTLTPVTAGTYASVSFVTQAGFVFQTNMTNSTVNAMVPSSGSFIVDVSYANFQYSFVRSYNSSGSTLILGSPTVSGFVYNATSGNPISNFNVILINSKAVPYSYNVLNFSSGAFDLANISEYTYMVVTAPGYQGQQYSIASLPASPVTVDLSPASSNVYYNYSMGSNPSYLNLSLKYVLGNSTALPFAGNSTVGSLYWQTVLDGGISSSYLSSFLQNATVKSTNYTITVDGYNYYMVKNYTSVTAIASGSGSAVFNATLEYYNSTIKSSDLTSGFTVNLYALGTQYTMGSLKYNYQFKYDIPGVALASPTNVVTSFKSPVNITPQATNGYLNLRFTPAVKPTVYASEINLYWNHMVSSNYVVNSSLNNTVMVVPSAVPVFFNVSQAYYNPVTGQHDYQSASFKWYNTTGTTPKLIGTSHNQSIDQFNSTGVYRIMLNYTSGSGVSNTTNFSVIALSSLQTPSAALNVSAAGKVSLSKTSLSSGNVEKMYVPQTQTVKFSSYGSRLMADSYNIPLTYTWYFAPIGSYTGYKSVGQNITQAFNTPSMTTLNSLKGPITGYLNVTSVAGTYANVTMIITVNDTTPPSPAMSLFNVTMATESNPVSGQVTTFSANSSTDPYYPQSSLSYNWSVVYANGTKVTPGNSTYTVVAGSLNNSNYVKIQFNTLSSLIMSLKATNPSNVSAYYNKTLTMIVDTPRIIVDSAYLTTTPDQGSTVTAYVNVSNNGTVNAGSFSLTLYVNGKAVTTHTYTSLPVGTTKKVEFNFSSPASGSVTFVFKAYNSSEPSFFADSSAYTFTHSVNPPAYKTPLIILGVIVVIIVISVAYYRLTSKGNRKGKETMPSTQKQQAPAKKDEKKK